jgi:hypothetical protein
MNLGNRSQLRVGYLYTRRDAEVNTGTPLLPEVERDDAGLTASFTFDSRDTPFNATRGGCGRARVFPQRGLARGRTATGSASRSASDWPCRCATTSSG